MFDELMFIEELLITVLLLDEFPNVMLEVNVFTPLAVSVPDLCIMLLSYESLERHVAVKLDNALI